MVNQGRDHPDIYLNGIAQLDQAFTDAVSAINDFQTALETGGQRLITVIQTARWVTTAILVVASGGAAAPLAGDIPMVASPLTTMAVGAAIGGGTEAATALGKMLINCAGGESVTGEQIKDACFDTVKGAVLGAIFAGVASQAPDLGEGILGREPTEEEEKIIEQAVEKILDGSAEQLTELAKDKEKPEFLEAAGNTVGLQLRANLPADMQAAIDKQKKS